MAVRPISLPDPQGMISRVKARMTRNCAVSRSPFCEVIISMRMQGIDFRSIEKWLIEQGAEHRISAPTICRNLAGARIKVDLSYAEEMAEKWGGVINLDLCRELSGQIVSQRSRIDRLRRREESMQSTNNGYTDKRISRELETLNRLILTLHGMMKNPLDAAKDAQAANSFLGSLTLNVTPAAVAIIKDMVLNGELQMGESNIVSAA